MEESLIEQSVLLKSTFHKGNLVDFILLSFQKLTSLLQFIIQYLHMSQLHKSQQKQNNLPPNKIDIVLQEQSENQLSYDHQNQSEKLISVSPQPRDAHQYKLEHNKLKKSQSSFNSCFVPYEVKIDVQLKRFDDGIQIISGNNLSNFNIQNLEPSQKGGTFNFADDPRNRIIVIQEDDPSERRDIGQTRQKYTQYFYY